MVEMFLMRFLESVTKFKDISTLKEDPKDAKQASLWFQRKIFTVKCGKHASLVYDMECNPYQVWFILHQGLETNHKLM